MPDLPDPRFSPPPAPDEPHGRRGFFSQLFGEAARPLAGLFQKKLDPLLNLLDEGNLAKNLPAPLALPQSTAYVLRPPGALPAGEFESTCTRCGTCAEVCPAECIKLDGTGTIAAGAPHIVPADRPCVMCDDLSCMKHCPTGALKPVDRLAIRMGRARVDHDICLRDRGEDCRLCVQACPVGDAAISVGAQTGKVRIHSGCTGCGLCENSCPTDPRSVVVRPVETRDEPMVW